jgi:hypothetical protein
VCADEIALTNLVVKSVAGEERVCYLYQGTPLFLFLFFFVPSLSRSSPSVARVQTFAGAAVREHGKGAHTHANEEEEEEASTQEIVTEDPLSAAGDGGANSPR